MTKLESMTYLKRKLEQQRAEESVSDAIIPFSKRDVNEELELMDSFNEHRRDKKTSKNNLTSDET
jgi:hypothetical protein